MESAILYTCWKKLPRIIGIAKTVSALRGESVIKYSSFDMIIFLPKIVYRKFYRKPRN